MLNFIREIRKPALILSVCAWSLFGASSCKDMFSGGGGFTGGGGGSGGPKNPPANGTPGTGNGTLGGGNGCLSAKAKNFHFVFVFDSSGSQENTDPTKIRKSAANDFATKLANLNNPNVTIKAAVVRFSSKAALGSQGWIVLNPANLPKMQTDIAWATDKPDSGTNYTPALQTATTAFATVGASPQAKDQRNYVIFLTDGQPDDDDKYLPVAQSMTTQLGVAIIAVASGTGVNSKGEAAVRAMALPLQGIVDPQHIGIYQRAAQATDLGNTFTQIFNQLIGNSKNC